MTESDELRDEYLARAIKAEKQLSATREQLAEAQTAIEEYKMVLGALRAKPEADLGEGEGR